MNFKASAKTSAWLAATVIILTVLASVPAMASRHQGNTPSLSASAGASLQAEVDKIKDNLNQDPSLFKRYVKETFGLTNTFQLLDNAKLDGDTLVNPAGGALSLRDLKNLPDIAGVEMLQNGGFKISYTPPSRQATAAGPIDVIVIGASKVQAAGTGISIDGMEVKPTSTVVIRKEQTSTQFTGAGTVTIDGKQFDISSSDPGLTTAFNFRDGRFVSVAMPPDPRWEYELNHANHRFSPRDAAASLHFTKADYDSASGNKILLADKIIFNQDSGTLLVDRFYHFENGRASVVRRAFLTGQPITPLDYYSKGRLAATLGPADPKRLGRFTSVADLFSAFGYGDGSENRAARRAVYEQYIGKGKISYRGTAAQNQELLSRLQRGEIPIAMTKGSLEQFARTKEGTASTRLDRVSGGPVDAANRPVRTSSVPIQRPGKGQHLLLPLNKESTSVFEGPDGLYRKWINAARKAGRSEEEIKAAFGQFKLPEGRQGNPPTDYTERKGTATHFTTLVPRERITPEGLRAGIAPHLEGTHINQGTASFGNHAINSDRPLQFGDIAVRGREYRQLSRQGINFLYLEFRDAPAQNGWYRMKDVGFPGIKGPWVDVWAGVGQQTTINTVNQAFNGKSSLPVRILIPNDPDEQPST